ncbi:hypothetical protein QZH41_005622, partial [Actinostola sp. cb2023]
QHYWYDISKNMNCKDFYPVFIMYNRNRLEGFGWNTNGDLKSPRYEHPTSDRFGSDIELTRYSDHHKEWDIMKSQHYWYDISKNMNCKDFYPVFIMYNRNRLEGFGWNTNGDLKSPRYEHPTSDRFGFDSLPRNIQDARSEGWRLTKRCSGKNYFAGNRYVLNGDTAVMLLFGANGQVAGMQMGVSSSLRIG